VAFSQGFAVFVGVTLSYDRSSLQNRIGKYVFQFLTLVVILTIKWITEPWYISMINPTGSSVSSTQVDQFRKIIIPANILIAGISMIVISYGKNKYERKHNDLRNNLL
jgi:hypothetical protein